MIRITKHINVIIFVFFLSIHAPSPINAASSLNCLKPTDIGIDHILSVRPVRGPLKELLGRCNLLKNVETVRYFTEKSFQQGTLMGLTSGCLKSVYYLNLAELHQLLKSLSCPR